MRLTPAPLHLLVAMSRGAVLKEVQGWYLLERPGREDCERVHARGANTLRRLGLIEREGEFKWAVSGAGRAWLARTGIAAKSDKLSRQTRPESGSNGGCRGGWL